MVTDEVPISGDPRRAFLTGCDTPNHYAHFPPGGASNCTDMNMTTPGPAWWSGPTLVISWRDSDATESRSRCLNAQPACAGRAVEPSAIESLTAPSFLASAAEDEAEALQYLRHASENLRRAAAAGVPIALGTDVNNPFVFPGYSVHEELAWMVRAGLTPAQALHAATAGAAAFLRAADRIGAIAQGFEADLVLVSGNPLERIENSRRVVTDV